MCMKVGGGGVGGGGGTRPTVGKLLTASLCWSDLVSKEAIVSCLGQLMKIKITFFFSFFLLMCLSPRSVLGSQPVNN